MTVAHGYILTDEYGDTIGLTRAEAADVVAAYDAGSRGTARCTCHHIVTQWGAIYSDDRQDFMVSSGADGCVIVDKADIEALRALLETTP